MAEQNRTRRAVELLKDILIVALTCSAVFLAARTSLFTQFRGWINPAPQETQTPAQQSEDGVSPYVICARNSLGLYGVSYDQDQVERVFDEVSPLLRVGLSTAAGTERITRWQWQGLLEAPGVSCGFQGSPPLPALSALLGGEENSANLTGNARALTLAWSGGQVWLAWRDSESLYYLARTGVAHEDLESALAEYSPNGTAYAYSLAVTDDAYDALDPYLPVSLTTPAPQSYTVSTPDFVGDQEALTALLNALGFRSGVGSAYESAGELALNENGDRLRVGSAGSVTFHAGEDVRYPVSTAGTPTAAQAALCAWELLNRASAPWLGEDDRYILTGVEPVENGWSVTFQTRLAGVPVLAGENGWSAAFTVTGNAITHFSLSLAHYSAAGTTTLLPSPRLAAAALRSVPNTDGQLTLAYSVAGGTAEAAWRAETV